MFQLNEPIYLLLHEPVKIFWNSSIKKILQIRPRTMKLFWHIFNFGYFCSRIKQILELLWYVPVFYKKTVDVKTF